MNAGPVGGSDDHVGQAPDVADDDSQPSSANDAQVDSSEALWDQPLPWQDVATQSEPDGTEQVRPPEARPSGTSRGPSPRKKKKARQPKAVAAGSGSGRTTPHWRMVVLGALLVAGASVLCVYTASGGSGGQSRTAAPDLTASALPTGGPGTPGLETSSVPPSPGNPSPGKPSGGTSPTANPARHPSSTPSTPSTPGTTSGAHPGPTHSTPAPRHSAPAPHDNPMVINATAVLTPGQSVHTTLTTLRLTSAGDLEVLDSAGHVRWSSGTSGRGTQAVFQGDGNLAVYAADSSTAWSSRTDGHNGATLVIQADGNLVIRYDGAVLWQTHTAR